MKYALAYILSFIWSLDCNAQDSLLKIFYVDSLLSENFTFSNPRCTLFVDSIYDDNGYIEVSARRLIGEFEICNITGSLLKILKMRITSNDNLYLDEHIDGYNSAMSAKETTLRKEACLKFKFSYSIPIDGIAGNRNRFALRTWMAIKKVNYSTDENKNINNVLQILSQSSELINISFQYSIFSDILNISANRLITLNAATLVYHLKERSIVNIVKL